MTHYSTHTARDSTTQTSIFAKLGRWAYRYRALVIAIWLILLLLSLALAPKLGNVLQGVVTSYEAGEAKQAETLLAEELSLNPDALTVVFHRDDQQSLVNQHSQIAEKLTLIRALPDVKSVEKVFDNPAKLSEGGDTTYSQIELRVTGIDVYPVIADIQEILDDNNLENLTAYLTGKAVYDYEDHRISEVDLVKAEALALPLTLIALLFVFGSAIAAILPVAMALLTVSVSSGLLYFLALQMDVSIFALNLTTMLGLGIGIDFTLVLVSRFREELSSHSCEQAVIRTMDTAGRAVFFSGLTTCIGLVSLQLFPLSLLQSLGIAGALVIFLSIAVALTLVPALFAVLDRNIDRWRIVRSSTGNRTFWRKFAQKVIKHSVIAVILVVLIVGLLVSPFFDARWGSGGIKTLPATVKARQGVEILENAFGAGATTPIWMAFSVKDTGSPILSEDHIKTLYETVEDLEADPRIAKVTSLFNLNPQWTVQDYQQYYQRLDLLPPPLADQIKALSTDQTTLVIVNSANSSNDEESFDLVRELRQLQLKGLDCLVGGQTANNIDTIEIVHQRLPWVLVTMMLVTFVALTILFQSVILPLQAIFLNIMSISASFGALVFVFQQGHFQTLLDFTPVGYIDILLPIVMFCLLFGLSMDYEVFLLTRMKEAYDRCGDNTTSIIEGLEYTGRIITSAAILLIIVTGAFAFTSLIFIKALGLGVAIAVLIDSTLIRAVLVPASMNLLGKWNWWAPRFLQLHRIRWRLD